MSNACTVALHIRDVPDDIRQVLARGRSLQAFLLTLVTDEARRSTNQALLERFDARRDGSRLSTAQAIEALDQARADREAPLLMRMWELRSTVSGYDAAYLAVAETFGCALVTADARLARIPALRCEVRLALSLS